ncbi:hypothetical protein Tco_0969645 [Tanacetum coccineum]
MHILNDPSFFLTNKTGAPQGEELGLMNPLSESSCNCSDNSFILDGANRYGARATGAAPGTKSIWNSTGRAGGRHTLQVLWETLLGKNLGRWRTPGPLCGGVMALVALGARSPPIRLPLSACAPSPSLLLVRCLFPRRLSEVSVHHVIGQLEYLDPKVLGSADFDGSHRNVAGSPLMYLSNLLGFIATKTGTVSRVHVDVILFLEYSQVMRIDGPSPEASGDAGESYASGPGCALALLLRSLVPTTQSARRSSSPHLTQHADLKSESRVLVLCLNGEYSYTDNLCLWTNTTSCGEAAQTQGYFPYGQQVMDVKSDGGSVVVEEVGGESEMCGDGVKGSHVRKELVNLCSGGRDMETRGRMEILAQ